MSPFFLFGGLLFLSAIVAGAYQAFTDTTPELMPARPYPRFHPSLGYLDARRKAFEVRVEIDK